VALDSQKAGYDAAKLLDRWCMARKEWAGHSASSF
jgi:hypothetical protein